MLRGCEHCGTVLRGSQDGRVDCRQCGRRLKRMDAYEAKVLMRERRIAEQFRRVATLTRTVEAGRALRPR